MHGTAAVAAMTGEDDAGLVARAAWLYHAGGLTQSEVAARLGVSSAKAHRLISRAAKAGLVRVFVDGPIGDCVAWEDALLRRHDLRFCRVVPALDGADLPVRALGIAAAAWLRDRLEAGDVRVMGVGHGRTLAALADYMPSVPSPGLRLVSLLGSLPRRHYANPYEVVDRLSFRTGADAHLLPVPLFSATAGDRAVMRRQAGVAESLALARQADLVVVGIGEAAEHSFLMQSGAISSEDMARLRGAGGEGEALGYFYGMRGRLVRTDLHARVSGLSLADLAAAPGTRDILAVAGGAGKVAAIDAVLRSRILTGLITDELTARQLVAADP